MKVSEVGEFGLIKLLTAELGIEYPPRPGAQQAGLLVGLGDDAVVSARRDGALVWTTDTMVAGVHFLPGVSSWRSVGWKALAVNLSDIAAMGATPHLALVTLMLPDDFNVEDAVELYRGLNDAATTYGVTLGGGDIVRAPVFAVTVALSGWAQTGSDNEPVVMTRDAARVGDVVAVSGHPGDSAGGLELLRTANAFETNSTRQLRAAHELPRPRLALGCEAVQAGVRCAIDVSDGLVQDLGHVATASNVAIRIDANRVPVSAALNEALLGRALGLALSGGEDYELLLVASQSVMQPLLDQPELDLTQIGEVVAGEARFAVVDETGREIELGRRGWDHFA